MFVKICANKSIEDAKMTIDAGADFLGVLVGQKHQSKDFVDKFMAKQIVSFANDKINTVLVTHLTDAKSIIELSKFIGNKFIQLHSNIDEDEVEQIKFALPNIKLIRVIHVSTDGKVLTNYKKFKFADFYLLDSINQSDDQVGGTGLTHNWKEDKKLIQKLTKPTFLAGGLTPLNVAKAIATANPAGVDVNSGCKKNGEKNKELVKDFVYNAKHA